MCLDASGGLQLKKMQIFYMWLRTDRRRRCFGQWESQPRRGNSPPAKPEVRGRIVELGLPLGIEE